MFHPQKFQHDKISCRRFKRRQGACLRKHVRMKRFSPYVLRERCRRTEAVEAKMQDGRKTADAFLAVKQQKGLLKLMLGALSDFNPLPVCLFHPCAHYFVCG
jgi:hypothetical protein